MRIPIRLKFSILILMLLFVTTGVIFWFTLDRVRRSLAHEIKLQGDILAHVIALNAEDPLIANDDLYLARLVTDAMKNEGVGYAYIIDKNNIIRAHNDIEYVGQSMDSFQPPHHLYQVTLPIVLVGKKEIGKVSVGLGTERMERTMHSVQFILVSISIVGVIFGVVGAVALSRYLTNPINRLMIGVKAIAEGDYNQSIRKLTNDEIGDLTTAFNQMALSLKEKEQIKDAFRRYVSHQVADEIFKNPEQYADTLKGSRRKVTIVFADIRGFTPLTERLSAERVVSLLNELLTVMTRMVFKYEGTIDKFIGDSMMAIFGAPIVHPDDVDRAIHTAVDIQKEIAKINKQRQAESSEVIKVGIGINTGEVVIGNIGAKVRLDYTVIGAAVNLANRLQEVAGGGEIVISEDVFKETQVPYKFSEPMLIKIKGKEAPVKVYSVLF